ncbi:MAG: DUF1874 domain-containing protein [Thermofilaceae archaeon]
MKYLVNAFSLNMFQTLDNITVTLHIKRISVEEFCREVKGEIVNAIGHASTVAVTNTMCNTDLIPNRIEIKLENGDELLIFQLKKRLEEGRILTADEVKKMFQSDQVELLKVKVLVQ